MSEINKLEVILKKIGLGHLFAKFQDQGVDLDTLAYIGDKDLAKLGVETVGDRARLQEEHRIASQSTSSSNSRISSIAQQRNWLFSPSSSSSRTNQQNRSRKRKSQPKPQPWTVNFVCIGNRFEKKVRKLFGCYINKILSE